MSHVERIGVGFLLMVGMFGCASSAKKGDVNPNPAVTPPSAMTPAPTEAAGTAPSTSTTPTAATATPPAVPGPTATPQWPQGRLARYEGSGRISDGGAIVSGTLDVFYDGNGHLRLHLHGGCTNSLKVIGVAGTVIATVVKQDGGVYSEVRLNIAEAPAAGLNGSTGREGDAEVTLSVNPNGSLPMHEVRFNFFDRNNPRISAQDVKAAVGMLLPLLL